MRVFLDTNVLVSAFATRGLCADLFELVLIEHELATGDQTLLELGRSLRGKLKLSAVHARDIVEFIEEEAVEVVRKAEPVRAAVDADDARVLGEALAAGAEVFVTGDAALLGLGKLGGIPIVAPRRFWEMLQAPAK